MELQEITQGLRGREAADIIYSNDVNLLNEINILKVTVNVLQQIMSIFTGKGAMVLWNRPANDIPPGWAEVKDWRGRLPMGWDPTQVEFNKVGNPGGKKRHGLTINQLPRHSHSLSNFSLWGVGGGSSHQVLKAISGGQMWTSETGGNEEFTLLNPYRVVIFIEWIG